MTNVKFEGWNETNVEQLKAAYKGDNTALASIGQELGGATIAQVRGKLVTEGVYTPNAPRATGGASPVRKIQIVEQIAAAIGEELEAVESLEKANKSTLEMLAKFLA